MTPRVDRSYHGGIVIRGTDNIGRNFRALSGRFLERERHLIRNLKNVLLFNCLPIGVLEFSHDPTRQSAVS